MSFLLRIALFTAVVLLSSSVWSQDLNREELSRIISNDSGGRYPAENYERYASKLLKVLAQLTPEQLEAVLPDSNYRITETPQSDLPRDLPDTESNPPEQETPAPQATIPTTPDTVTKAPEAENESAPPSLSDDDKSKIKELTSKIRENVASIDADLIRMRNAEAEHLIAIDGYKDGKPKWQDRKKRADTYNIIKSSIDSILRISDEIYKDAESIHNIVEAAGIDATSINYKTASEQHKNAAEEFQRLKRVDAILYNDKIEAPIASGDLQTAQQNWPLQRQSHIDHINAILSIGEQTARYGFTASTSANAIK